MIPCISHPQRWGGDDVKGKQIVKDDSNARWQCLHLCEMVPECRAKALKAVDDGEHPTGIYGGVFLPDDGRHNDNPGQKVTNDRMIKRRRSIAFLRANASVVV